MSQIPPEPLGYSPPPIEPNQDARTWGMLAHIAALAGFLIPFGSLIGPLVVWLIKRDVYPFVNDQGKESLNFQITVVIAAAISAVLMIVFIGFVLLPIVIIAALILVIIAAVKSSSGVYYRYPFTIRFIK